MAADATVGRPAWLLTLIGGAIAQAVVALLVLTEDRSGVRADVSRDIVIVGVLGIVTAIVVAVLAPSAGESKVVRRVLMGVIALVAFVSLAGSMAMAVTPWTAVPAGVMVIGLVLLYRDLKAGKGGAAQ
ncbi:MULTISPECIES: hypothetical protein [Corynebacterium]|uniref:Membrane channel-forming protein YqfA (Hemolysin III family) n=1 Tax=Corynebacterium freneyi TaxID=134034 RepID=A0ABS4UAT4_9CORY|nr:MULTISPECIES: hypothetical protein [Corynebacterium]MBP2333644.1 putative membrane channel-forming protein YqfA (hemolysin III family) [Corynebacterium freneyi]MCG7439302.1 hypothetical protein [Corynebacterium freneyi]MDK8768058.1 hypothetical protein [Corynebacterium freneyi]OFU55594.1 hypothetical protein HMPREF3121_05810 [Corynebacterium sp. HMSC11E11]QXA52342.1 hypothetical protein I6L56_09750 [Corynebacterium freneyi]